MSWLDKLITKDYSQWEFEDYNNSDIEERDRYKESPYYVRTLEWMYKDEED